MARKIVIDNSETNKIVKEVPKKTSRKFTKTKVNKNGKIISDLSSSNENIREEKGSDDKYVLIPKKQGYEKNPELYISEGKPLMTFNKEKEYKKEVLSNRKKDFSDSDTSSYYLKEKKIRGIDPRLPSEQFQEYKSDKLKYLSHNVLYKGKVYKIKDKYFMHFIKEAENALYSNIGSRNWARKVAEKELKDNGISISDNRLIVLPVDLKINGEKIDLPDYDEEELEKSVSSVPSPSIGF